MTQMTDRLGNTVELPKMTLEAKQRLDGANSAPQDKAGLTLRLNVLKEFLDDDYMTERLDGDTVDNVDVMELIILTSEVFNAYNAPIVEARAKEAIAQLEPLVPLMSQISALGGLQEPKRKGFNRVK